MPIMSCKLFAEARAPFRAETAVATGETRRRWLGVQKDGSMIRQKRTAIYCRRKR